jgi:hypothetical protein
MRRYIEHACSYDLALHSLSATLGVDFAPRTEPETPQKNKGSLFVSEFPIFPFFYLATDFDLPPSPSLRPICGVLRLW